jgi:uncharacterized protein
MRSATLRTHIFGTAAVALALLLCAGSPLRAQAPNQLKPQGYVNDFANVLSRSAKEQLTSLCAELDEKAHAQIAVVTVKSLDGRSIEDFSIDLATQWHIGPRKSDRGILILLAVDDRQYKFEVGYGLEPILPDGKVGGFGREAVPYLRERDYDAALLLMTRRVAEVIAADRGVTLSGSRPVPTTAPRNEVPPALGGFLLAFIGLGLFYAWMRMMATRARSPYSRRLGAGWWIGTMIGGWGGGGGFGGGGFGGGGGGFGGFGGGSFGGGGASGSW